MKTEADQIDELAEKNIELRKQLINLNHAVDVYWNDRNMHNEKYICYQQKKSLELLVCKDCGNVNCNCNEPF